jgi:hypothetical protein
MTKNIASGACVLKPFTVVIVSINEIVIKILVYEIIPSLTFVALPFWELGWPVK